MQFKLLSCEIFQSEILPLTAGSPHQIDIGFLPMELHGLGRTRRQCRLAEYIAQIGENNYDAVLLAGGLCGGVTGLTAGKIPLVIPKAHDCITLFLGCRKKYQEYFSANGGTYFLTAGWLAQNNALHYAEEMMPHYNRIAYIETGMEPDDSAKRQARSIAESRGWDFELLAGNLCLLQRLVQGDWDDDFLIIPPGAAVCETYNADILGLERI